MGRLGGGRLRLSRNRASRGVAHRHRAPLDQPVVAHVGCASGRFRRRQLPTCERWCVRCAIVLRGWHRCERLRRPRWVGPRTVLSGDGGRCAAAKRNHASQPSFWGSPLSYFCATAPQTPRRRTESRTAAPAGCTAPPRPCPGRTAGKATASSRAWTACWTRRRATLRTLRSQRASPGW